MNDLFILSLFLTLVVVSILLIHYCMSLYYHKNLKRYSIFNQFPFELLFGLSPKHQPYFRVFFTLLGMGWFTFYWMIFPLLGTSWTVPMFILVILLWIMFFFMMTMQAKRIERFVFVSSFVHMLIIVLPAVVFIFTLTSPYDRFTSFLPWGSVFIAGLQGLLLFLPSLKTWSKLEEKRQGEVIVYVRPKMFLLALLQWGYLMSFYLLNLFILIALWI